MSNAQHRFPASILPAWLVAPSRTAGQSGSDLYHKKVKRPLDVALVLCFALVFLPFLLLIALALLIAQGRPILISHQRVGQNGVRFGCLKFRSMVRNADDVLRSHLAEDPAARAEWAKGRKLKSDPRVTPLGRLLRKASVDELPQLLNVLRGDMSLVGPRPIVEQEVPFYGAAITHYHRVRPGLTGHWQVSGRSDVSYPSRIQMDIDYVDRIRFGRDLLIILKTVPAVVTSRGSY